MESKKNYYEEGINKIFLFLNRCLSYVTRRHQG